MEETSLPIGDCGGGGVSGSSAAMKASVKGDAEKHRLKVEIKYPLPAQG